MNAKIKEQTGLCGIGHTTEASPSKKQPHWCGACRKGLSVRTGTALERSRVPLRKWAITIYLEMVSLNGASSMRLHRGPEGKAEDSLVHIYRICEAWTTEAELLFSGPVEVDETYIGGQCKNMPKAKWKALAGRGAVGKVIVAGAKDRATNRVSASVIDGTDKPTLQTFVGEHAALGATVYTYEHGSYQGMPFDHEAVNHSVGEYIRQQVHINGMESFWSLLKRGYRGTFHHLSAEHLNRYVAEFAARHNVRESDTIDQMASIVAGMVGKRLMYQDLITR